MSILRSNRLWLAALSLTLGACHFSTQQHIVGSGHGATESRSMAPFSRVSLAGGFEVEIRSGTGTSAASEVVIDADDNLLSYIETSVEGDTLTVRIQRGFRISPRPRLLIQTDSLTRIGLAGSSDIVASGVTGASFGIDIAGSGSVRVQGEVDTVSIDIAGSGDVRIVGLKAREASVSIAGSGDVELTSTESLDVHIAGSGDVRYSGNPRVSQRVAGSGNIEQLPSADIEPTADI